MAVRSAYSLGLHVRNEDPSAIATKRETLVRIWWSLYSLEQTLSVITGRPSMMVDSYCSVSLPIPVPENVSGDIEAAYRMWDGNTTILYGASPTFSVPPSNGFAMTGGAGTTEPNSGSYFRAAVELSVITHKITLSLYSPDTSFRSANEAQRDTVQLLQRLDKWATALPVEFNSQDTCRDLSNKFSRERMLLGFQFCSARILLARPHLTLRRQSWNETKEASFSRRMASLCVEAAKSMVASLPDEPHPTLVFDQGPWWCIVHHLMQAISVFLLELSHPSSATYESMVYHVEKALRWLEVMQDPIARRAHSIALNLFQNAIRQPPEVSPLPWASQAQAQPAGVGPVNVPRQEVTDTVLDAYYPASFATMTPPSAVDSYGPYGTAVNFSSYPTAPAFARDFYLAR